MSPHKGTIINKKERVVFQAPFLRGYCSWKKSRTTKKYENCDVSHLNWSAGFFPSTVWGSFWGSTIPGFSPAKRGKPWNICQILPSTLRNGSWRVPMPALHYLRLRKALIKWLLGFILKWGTEDLNLSLGIYIENTLKIDIRKYPFEMNLSSRWNTSCNFRLLSMLQFVVLELWSFLLCLYVVVDVFSLGIMTFLAIDFSEPPKKEAANIFLTCNFFGRKFPQKVQKI